MSRASAPQAPGHQDVTPDHIILVRPWRDHHAGPSCCGATPSQPLTYEALPHHHAEVTHGPGDQSDESRLGACYRLARQAFPASDVQIASANNVVWLLPAVFRQSRNQGCSRTQAAQRAIRATTAGAVLVNGDVIANVADASAEAIVLRAGTVLASGKRPLP